MHKKSSNRSFGILFFIVFLGFGLWPLTKEMSPNVYLIIISVIFLTLGLLNSKLLSPLNEIWIKFGLQNQNSYIPNFVGARYIYL